MIEYLSYGLRSVKRVKTLLELITIEMETAFEKAGYERDLAKVTLSNRPDLCAYQCNGAMAGGKKNTENQSFCAG